MVSFSLSASIPVDNSAVLVNPMTGAYPNGKSGWQNMLTLISGVSGSTLYMSGTWGTLKNFTVGRQITHFNTNQTVRGVIAIASKVNDFQITFTTVSGSAPVENGFLLAPTEDFSVMLAKVTWKQLEAVKGVYDWAGVELSSGITAAKALGKKFSVLFQLDVPSGAAHHDVPDWYYSESGEDGWAYTAGGDIGWAPNYANTTLIAYHQAIINAMAARWGSDPAFAFMKLGSVGHWGEWHHATAVSVGPTYGFPANTVTAQYIDHYANAFGVARCAIRRNVQRAVELGMSTFIDGFLNDASMFTNNMGGLNSMLAGGADMYGYTQPAYASRAAWLATGPKFGEPQTDDTGEAFADEPVSITQDADVTEQGSWTNSGTIAKKADTGHWRVDSFRAASPSTAYYVHIHPDYMLAIFQATSAGAYVAVNAKGNGTTQTTGATCARLFFSVYKVAGGVMTAADYIRACPRLYLNSASYKTRNVRLTLAALKEYPLSLYTSPFDKWRYAAPATEANSNTILRRLGYRLRPIAASLTDATLAVTMKNDGCDRAWCGERRLKVGLFTGTTLVKSWESSTRVDDIASDATKVVDVTLDTIAVGVYTFAIGLCVPSGTPDLSLPATALAGKWYSVGTITVTAA